MKLALLTDTQLESRPSRDRLDSRGKSVRFQENLATILDIIGVARQRECTGLVHLGDVSEETNASDATHAATARMFRAAKDGGMIVDVLAGNHDVGIFEISSSSIEAMSIITDGLNAYHDIASRAIPGGHLVFLPYLHGVSPAEIKKRLGAAIEGLEGNLYLFAHYGVTGATVGPKNIILPGDVLDADTLHAKRFKAIACGHYHKKQIVKLNEGSTVHFPGSPFIVDRGERGDPKGFCILDTETGEIEHIVIPPKRRWLDFSWDDKDAKWTADDIVTFTGLYQAGESPQQHIRTLIKSGAMPEPFSKAFDVTSARAARVVKAGDISASGGFRESAAAFIAKRWPDDIDNPKVLELVLAHLEETKTASRDKKIVPLGIKMTDFMSHAKFEYDFIHGEPTLITGTNGIGKTNILEAILLCLVGETSKQVDNETLVRQGAKKAIVEMVFAGEKSFYRIMRTITLSADAAKHKVNVWNAPGVDGPWDPAHSLADGGVKETQAVITGIIGATFLSLKATNFKFQGEHSPLVNALPKTRRSVLAEILGFDPMIVAWKALNEERKEASRQLADTKSRLEATQEAFDDSKLPRIESELAQAENSLDGCAARVAEKAAICTAALEAETSDRDAVGDAEVQIGAIPDNGGEIGVQEGAIAALAEGFKATRDRRIVSYRAAVAERDGFSAKLGAADADKLTADIGVAKIGLAETTSDISAAAIQISDFQQVLTAILSAELPPAQEKYVALKTEIDVLESNRKTMAEVMANFDSLRNQDTAAGLAECQRLHDHIKSCRASMELVAAQRQAIVETELPGLRETVTRLKTELKALKDELDAHSGSDIGQCSKCGQAIDSSKAEALLADLNAKIAKAEADLVAPQAEIARLEKIAGAAVMTADAAGADIESSQKLLSDAEAKIADVESAKFDWARLNSDLDTILATLSKKRADILAPEAEINELNTRSGDAATAIKGLQLNVQSWEAKKLEFEANLSRLEAQERELGIAKMALKTSETKISEIEAEGLAAETVFLGQKKVLDENLEALKAVASENAAKKAVLVASLEALVSLASASKTAADGARTALEAAKAESGVLEANVKHFRLQIAEIRDTVARIADLKTKFAERDINHKLKVRATDVLDPKSGLPAYLIETKIPELEDGINRYLSSFEPDIPIQVFIETRTQEDEDAMNILIDNGVKPDLDARAYSGGQLELVEWALSMALTDVAENMRDTSLGFMGLDETASYLDQARKQRLIELIHERVASGRSPVALVIHHDRQMINGFGRRFGLRQDEN